MEIIIQNFKDIIKAFKNQNTSIFIVKLIFRPWEGLQYDEVKKKCSKIFYDKVIKFKIEWMREKENSFVDLL